MTYPNTQLFIHGEWRDAAAGETLAVFNPATGKVLASLPHASKADLDRALDAATNPYLSFALLLAAGLKGIEEGYELPEGSEEDVWELTDAERKAAGIKPLPQSLDKAIELMEQSELVAETLGEHVFDYVLRNKRQEWDVYRSQVTQFELDRFLPVL